MTTRRPDFFIVGAPKCGTTAMYDYLRQHPDIFMAQKELHYFDTDFPRLRTERMSLDDYLAYFREARDEARVGEASVRYLYSRAAAAEIVAFAPAAQAIVMLREPVEMMYSMHAQQLFAGTEEIADFAAALDAEEDRRAGRRIPPGTNVAEVLQYRDVARYAGQLERCFATFGRDRVHVIIYDDFKADALAAYRGTLEFLGVDQAFVPEIRVVNPSKTARSATLQRLLASPPARFRSAVRAVMPRPMRKRVWRRAMQLNARAEARRPLDPALRARLRREFAPEVRRLAEVLGRDLPSSWSVE